MQYCQCCFLVKTKNQFCSKCSKKLFKNNIYTSINHNFNFKNLDFYDSKLRKSNMFFSDGNNLKALVYLKENNFSLNNPNNHFQFLIKNDYNGEYNNINEHITQKILEILFEEKNSVVESFLLNVEDQYFYMTKLFTHNDKGQIKQQFKSIVELKKEYNIKEGFTSIEQCLDFLLEYNILKYPEKDIKKYIQMCVYDIILGNTDRHGNNFGVLFDLKEKKGVFAPVFDTLNLYIEYNEHPYPLRFSLLKNFKKRIYSQKEFQKLIKKYNIESDWFDNILEDIQKKSSIIYQIIQNSPFCDNHKEDYLNFIHFNSKNLNLNIDFNNLEEKGKVHEI